jgi:hypothetical protein
MDAILAHISFHLFQIYEKIFATIDTSAKKPYNIKPTKGDETGGNHEFKSLMPCTGLLPFLEFHR